jgi:hypothetical protein
LDIGKGIETPALVNKLLRRIDWKPIITVASQWSD